MQVELLTFSIISLVFTTLLLGFVLGVVVVSYRKILDKLHTLREKELEAKNRLYKEESKILDEARSKAMQIIASANTFSESQQKSISQELTKFSQDQKASYSKLVEQVISQIKKSLEEEILSSKDNLTQKLSAEYESEYAKIKEEISAYKKEELGKIDERVKFLIKEISIEVLSNSLGMSDHEQLILKSLEEAKQHHVI